MAAQPALAKQVTDDGLHTLRELSGVRSQQLGTMHSMTGELPDALDDALLRLFAAEPRVGMLEASRRLGVARGTVTSRLERLQRSGVVRGWGPELDPAAMGYVVTAFATLEIRQGSGHGVVAGRLRRIPEVIEVHTITGPGDLLCRLVARSNADLQRVIDLVVAGEDIVRTSTVIVLATEIAHRTLPLLGTGTPTGAAAKNRAAASVQRHRPLDQPR